MSSDVPANTTEMTTSASTVNKVRALKQPATRQMSQLPKPEGNGKSGMTELHCSTKLIHQIILMQITTLLTLKQRCNRESLRTWKLSCVREDLTHAQWGKKDR